MALLRILRADWLLTKRTGYRWLVFAAPPLAAGILLWYYSGRPVTPGLANSIYDAFFQLIASALPLAIGLLSGMLAMQEEQAGRFGGLLGRRQPRALSYAGKLLMVALPVGCGIFAATLLLVTGMGTLLGIANADAGFFSRERRMGRSARWRFARCIYGWRSLTGWALPPRPAGRAFCSPRSPAPRPSGTAFGHSSPGPGRSGCRCCRSCSDSRNFSRGKAPWPLSCTSGRPTPPSCWRSPRLSFSQSAVQYGLSAGKDAKLTNRNGGGCDEYDFDR